MYNTYKNYCKIDNFDEVKGIFTGKVCRLGENPNNLRNLNFHKTSFDNCINNKFITANIEHNNCIKVADSVKIWRDDNYLYSEITVADYFKKDEKRYSYLIDKYNKGQLYFSLGGKMLDSELKRNNQEQYYQNIKRFGRAKLKDTVYKFKLDHIAFTTTPVDTEAEVFQLQSDNGITKYNILIDDNFNKEEALLNWKRYTGSLEAPSPIYSQGFLYSDITNKEDFNSYDYLFVNIVDLKPYISEKAIIDLFDEIYNNQSIDKFIKIKLLEKIDLILLEINKLREQKNLPTISFNKMTTRQEINAISGKVSAAKFLKKNKTLSNNMIDSFIEKLFDLNKKANTMEERGQSPALIAQSAQCEEQQPIEEASNEISLITLAEILKQKSK